MDFIYRTVMLFSQYRTEIAVTIFILVLGLVGYFLLMVRAARRKHEETATPGAADSGAGVSARTGFVNKLSALALRRSFHKAVRALQSGIPGRNRLYQVPWYLFLGESGAGKTTALKNLDLHLPLGKPQDLGLSDGGCSWNFYDKGVVLDVDGALVLRQDGASDDKLWRTFVELLRRHRPERPLDGVVLSIPCGDLIGTPDQLAQRQAQVADKARLLYRKLSDLQKATGMCFPVYVLVTQCDRVRGFKPFANELPPAHRDDLFGWSSPHTLETAYAPEWADVAFKQTFNGVLKGQMELMSDGIAVEDADGFFLFPTEFQAVAEPLRVYLDHLFRESVYHDAFFLRGVYFCGDGVIEEIPALVGEASGEGALLDEPPLGPPGFLPKLLAPSEINPPFRWQTGESLDKKPYFIKHLFERKVFPEFALARPASPKFLSTNRSIRTVQVLVGLVLLIGGLGLWSGYSRLVDDRATLEPVLRQTLIDLGRIKYERVETETAAERSFFYKSALNLLNGMTQISTNRYGSFFLPVSWFDPINDEIHQAMTLAYNKIILKSLYFELEDRARAIMAEAERYEAPADAEAPAEDFEQLQEMREMRRFVAELGQLERAGRLYNGLKTSQDLTDLGEVVHFLYKVQLPPGFYTNAFYYHRALQNTQYPLFQAERYRAPAGAAARRLSQLLYDRVFRVNNLDAQLRSLALQIMDMETDGGKAPAAQTVFTSLENVIDEISNKEILLHRPEFAWLAKKKLDLGTGFKTVMESTAKSVFLGPEVRRDIETAGDAAFQNIRESLASRETGVTGPLLARGPGVIAGFLAKAKEAVDTRRPNLADLPALAGGDTFRLELSPGVLALRQNITDFLGRKFINVGLPQKALMAEPPQGARLFWDTHRLEDAIGLYRLYEEFLHEGALRFPESMRDTVKRAARNRLERNMLLAIAHAQTFKPGAREFARTAAEHDLGPEIENFKQAARSLAEVMDIFNQLDLADASWIISKLTAVQAGRLLQSADRILEEENLYHFREGSFAWWDGLSRASLVAFEVRDPKELEFYLELQRGRVRRLGRDFAEPLVRFLVDRTFYKDSEYQSLIVKWQTVLLELARLDGKKTGNSVTALEKFILFDMDKISPANRCLDATLKDMPDPAGDYFLQKLATLRKEVAHRCQSLIGNEVVREYSIIETHFNKNLAGKYPFAPEPGEGGMFTEAAPEAVREFFWLFDQYKKIGLPLLQKSSRFGVSGEETLDFVDKMEKVRDFFSPFLGKGKGERRPTYILDVDFRANREAEIGGNQIIDWNLDVGKQSLSFLGEKRPLLWSYGDPVTLSLRWAKDSPLQPILFGQTGAVVDNRTVSFHFDNRWSILSLLRRQAGTLEDFPMLADPKPHTLRFTVELSGENQIITRAMELKAAQTAKAGETKAKVYVRVGVVAPEKNEEKLLPEFPMKAPHLSEELRSTVPAKKKDNNA
jgi:type VI secretion system protein ImpL